MSQHNPEIQDVLRDIVYKYKPERLFEDFQRVRIEMAGPGYGKVMLDDVEVPNVTAARFEVCVGEMNKLHLTLNVGRGDVTSLADVSRQYKATRIQSIIWPIRRLWRKVKTRLDK